MTRLYGLRPLPFLTDKDNNYFDISTKTMDEKAIYKYCKILGCCESCCLRYLGIRSPSAYQDSKTFGARYNYIKEILNTNTLKDKTSDVNSEINKDDKSTELSNENDIKDKNNVEKCTVSDTKENNEDVSKEISKDSENNDMEVSNKSYIKDKIDLECGNESTEKDKKIIMPVSDNPTDVNAQKTENSSKTSDNFTEDNDGGPPKRQKLLICCSCLGILQEITWGKCLEMTKEVFDKKGYECSTFACGLSSPIALLVRERAITLRLASKFPAYDQTCLTPLKEAWKWSFGVKLATHIDRVLDSGAISPLLIIVNMDYDDDLQELEILKAVSPQLFESRSKQRRFVTEFTRRSVEQALDMATLAKLIEAGGALPSIWAPPHCAGVTCSHAPCYLGARYIKLSRNLPQSPWILNGERIVPSSVQEIIFGPIAKLYNLKAEEMEHRLKFIAAGREDVDVRCLGEGRPFAVEITDPAREPSPAELARACQEITDSGDVLVKRLVPITREDLTQLKKGEEKKCKTYEALCIKLSHSKYDEVSPESPVSVSVSDIGRINAAGRAAIDLQQKTPIRVLHRRPLLNRPRHILAMEAVHLPDRPRLFKINIRTSAGTYVKEWVHGDLGRTKPALANVMGASVDLLALDVTGVLMEWPPSGS